jgi:hypothetical protein
MACPRAGALVLSVVIGCSPSYSQLGSAPAPASLTGCYQWSFQPPGLHFPDSLRLRGNPTASSNSTVQGFAGRVDGSRRARFPGHVLWRAAGDTLKVQYENFFYTAEMQVRLELDSALGTAIAGSDFSTPGQPPQVWQVRGKKLRC